MSYDEQILYKVAQMYYIDNLTQAEISGTLKLSRPKVSRLLTKAREDGVVQISLSKTPENSAEELQLRIKARLGLANVLVVPSVSANESENLRAVAGASARFFQQFIKDGDKIGISWGYTLMEIAKALPVASFPRSSIVQIAGNLDNADSTNYANDIIRQFGERMCIDHKTTLPCPILVENSIIVDLLLHDSKISSIIDQINAVDVAFLNVGMLSENNCLCRTGFVTPEDLLLLQNKQSVGCICSRFIDIDGNVVDEAYNSRTISIALPVLKKVRVSCACIATERKVPALLGAIRGGLVNTAAMDSDTAEQLLRYAER
ncbi:MAG: sugar-binding domain-containing protein [Oscillospiraceae bacterium]|nr:sugar-binding domain-containing protein [Oscillospiraceae bacterium]